MTDVDIDQLGPIDYLVVEFPANAKFDGSALLLLGDLVDRGLIHILDLGFVQKLEDGSVAGVNIADFDLDGEFDLELFEAAKSGLLGDDDLAEAAAALEPGCSAAVLIYENAWAAPFATELRRKGAQLVAGGRIPTQAILAALDELG